jgi:hypothetical protein
MNSELVAAAANLVAEAEAAAAGTMAAAATSYIPTIACSSKPAAVAVAEAATMLALCKFFVPQAPTGAAKPWVLLL